MRSQKIEYETDKITIYPGSKLRWAQRLKKRSCLMWIANSGNIKLLRKQVEGEQEQPPSVTPVVATNTHGHLPLSIQI